MKKIITSVTVSGGEHTPDNPVTVKFYIKNRVYTVSNGYIPRADHSLYGATGTLPLPSRR